MGRKKRYSSMVPVIVRMEGELLRLVDESAREQNLSRNSLMTSLIARNFNELGLAHRETRHVPSNTEDTIMNGTDASERNNRYSSASGRREIQELRKKVVAGYGGQCACCGEERIRFLNVDHINGKDGRRGSKLLRFIIRHNFPPQYHVLCFNCNLGRKLNGGICPHVV
jgi:hypothetical protein